MNERSISWPGPSSPTTLRSYFLMPSAFLEVFHYFRAWSECALKHIPFLDILWCPLHSWHSYFPPLPPPVLFFVGCDIVMPRRFLLLILPEAMFEALSEIETVILSTFRLLLVPAVGFDLSLAESLVSRYVLTSRAINRGFGYTSLFLYFNVPISHSVGRLHTSMYARMFLTFNSLKFVSKFESMTSIAREKVL
jgi:hypothetical protein